MSKTCRCGTTLGAKNQSGQCRSCLAKRINADPLVKAARAAGIRRKFATDPEFAAAQKRRFLKNTASPRSLETKRQHGLRQIAILQSPEVRAKSNSPEARARAGASISATRLAWCPVELRDRYRMLVRSKRMRAADARAKIEGEMRWAELSRVNPAPAADFLQRVAPITRCDADGRHNPNGTHWRRGSSVLTAVDVIERAMAKGWQPAGWKLAA